jgi:molybdopterin-guanine dinucleotide biosynthesis protein A
MPSAAILAGGHGRRFGGRDKSALLVGGRSILERQIDVLSEISDDVLIVGGGHGVPDRVPDCGPLGGLDAALASARHDLLVLVACDMPFLRADFLKALLSMAHGVDAVVPRSRRGYHPLCAVYARSCHTTVQERLAARQLAMMALLEPLRVRAMEAHQIESFGLPDPLANMNTAAEFDDLAAVVGHKF